MFSVLSVYVFSACSHKSYKYNETVGNEASGLKLTVDWLKNKKKQIDLKLDFENVSSDELTVNENAITVLFSGQAGVLKSENASILLSPKQKASRVLMYSFAPPVNGPGMVTLSVDPIVLRDTQGKTRNTKVSVNLQVP
jgi:hypothetical protein